MELALFIVLDFISYTLWLTYPSKVLTFKKNKKWILILMIAINCAQSILVRIIPELYSSPLKSLVFSAEYAAYIIMAYKEPIGQKIIAFIFYLMSVAGADVAVLGFLSLLGYDYTDSLFGISMLFFGGILCTVFSYFLMLGFSIIYNKIKYKKVTNKLWQFQIIIFSQFLFVVLTIFANFRNNNSIEQLITQNPGYGIMVVITIVIAVIGDVCLFKILMTNSQNFELKRELELLETKEKLELEYYEKLRKNVAETRKLNHDFSNAIAVIEGIINSDDIQENRRLATEVVDEIKETLKKNKVRNYCENELVNLIVINKSEEISQTGADFSANLDIPQNINIKSFDLCRIFTNLLDNAKEACLLTKDKEKCFVVLSAEIKDDFLYITCENYYDSDLSIKKDKLLSTKENHKGLGLEIIKEIANNYQGNCKYSYINNIFTVSLTTKIQ